MIREINVQTGVGTSRPMTAEEQTASDTITAQELAAKPMKDWLNAMTGTDAIPRWAEDIISGDSPAQSTLDAVAVKKALRLTKP